MSTEKMKETLLCSAEHGKTNASKTSALEVTVCSSPDKVNSAGLQTLGEVDLQLAP